MVLSFLPLHKLRSTNHQLLQPLHYPAPQSPSLATSCSYNEIFLSVLLKHIHRHFPSTTNTLFQNTSSLPLNYWSYLRPSSHLFLLPNSPLGYNQRNHQITLPTFTSQFTVLAFQAVSVAYPYLGPTTRPATSRLPLCPRFLHSNSSRLFFRWTWFHGPPIIWPERILFPWPEMLLQRPFA